MLLSVIIIALVYLATSTTTAAAATLAFAFVLTSMGMGHRKGLTMALLSHIDGVTRVMEGGGNR